MENSIKKARLTEVRQHGLKFTLVPALGDTSSDVEIVARDSEKVLSLTGSWGKVVCEVASVGS